MLNYRLSITIENTDQLVCDFYAVDHNHAAIVARAYTKTLICRYKGKITRDNFHLTTIK